VVLYAALVGILLASYLSPLQSILENRSRIPALQTEVDKAKEENATKEQLAQDLTTPEGVEKAARERYGMVKPGEKIYIVEGEKR
jgi:cell division protein FtsB